MQIQDGEIRQYLANTAGRESEEDWFAPQVFTGAVELLEEARRGGPFFLVADCYDPHEPWDPPRKYVDLYDPDGYEGPEPITPNYAPVENYLTRLQLLRMRDLYSAEVTMADHWLGNFLDRAYDLGVMENTLLVVISDHGHLLGEHGYTGKLHYALYPELTDIMFMVRHPEGKEAGKTNAHYASTHDVTPTILGTLGVEPRAPLDGQDLSALPDEKSPETRPHFTSAYGEHVWCRDDKAEARLYDLSSDPGEENKTSPKTIPA